jgi:hypothetical protein
MRNSFENGDLLGKLDDLMGDPFASFLPMLPSPQNQFLSPTQVRIFLLYMHI